VTARGALILHRASARIRLNRVKLFENMKKEIMPGAPNIEQKKVATAAEVLLDAAKQGVMPAPEVRKQLIDMWQKAADKPAVEKKAPEVKVDALASKRLIEQYVHDENNDPGMRNVDAYCEKMGVERKKFDAQAVIPALIKSLPKDEPLEVIARYLTLVHDNGPAWGGGQHNGFGYELPREARLLAERLKKELQSGHYDLSDRSFEYILYRIGLGYCWEQVASHRGYDEKKMTQNEGVALALTDFIESRREWEEGLKKKEKA